MFRDLKWDDIRVSVIEMERRPCFGSWHVTTSMFRVWKWDDEFGVGMCLIAAVFSCIYTHILHVLYISTPLVSGFEMGRHACFGSGNETTSLFRSSKCDDIHVSGLEMGRRPSLGLELGRRA